MSTQSKRGSYRFGEKLRIVRERKGYTLKKVAETIGVSESLISQIERNKVSPAIDTLMLLVEALEINLEYLFEEYKQKKTVKIIKSNERRKIKEDTVLYEELANHIGNNESNSSEFYLITVPAKTSTHRGTYGHAGYEHGFIMEGSILLHYESQVYELSTGDSVTFSAGTPHIIENTSNTIAKAIWVVSPPQRFT